MANVIHGKGSRSEPTVEVRRFQAQLAEGESVSNRYVTLLGLRTYDSERLVRKVEEGLPFTTFERMRANLKVPALRFAEWVDISPRTLARRRERGHLDPAESDRVLRASRLLGQAIELFEGDVEGARRWLRTPQRGLGSAVPLDYARTEIGAREVERLIGRLEHGVFT